MVTPLRPQEATVPLGLKYHHVDVFSSKPLSGNGVTVFRLGEALPTAVMQELTREMRQFESIFVLHEAGSQTVRAWVFTMEEELDFAGHPVLGAAAHNLRSRAVWHHGDFSDGQFHVSRRHRGHELDH